MEQNASRHHNSVPGLSKIYPRDFIVSQEFDELTLTTSVKH